MGYFYGVCVECGEESYVNCNGDDPHFCPHCRSVDTMKEVEDEEYYAE